MQVFMESRTINQIRLRIPLGKEIHLFGCHTCTTSSSLTGVKCCDFYQVLRHCEIIAFDTSDFSHYDCQTRLFLHKLCLPALAARKV